MISKRKGAGGLFFIFTVLFGATIMIFLVDISRESVMKSVTDNVAYVVATKVAIYSYNDDLPSYTVRNRGNIDNAGRYRPLDDFNSMMSDYGAIDRRSTRATIRWNSSRNVATVSIGEYQSTLGVPIKPQDQNVIIENR